MKKYHTGGLFLSLIVFLCVVFFPGCGIPRFSSRWLDRPITIDGADPEWGNYIQYYDENTRVIVCLFNDDKDLYIKLSTPNRMIQAQFMRMGLTVWFDPAGGKNKTFGIHFPLVLSESLLPPDDSSGNIPAPDIGGNEPPAPDIGGNEPPAPGFNENGPSDRIKRMIGHIRNELEITVPDRSERIKLTLPEAAAYGISSAIGMAKESLVYELKVPLAGNDRNPYAIGTSAGKTIGLGFEVEKNKKNATKNMPREENKTRDDRNIRGDSGRSIGGIQSERTGGRRGGRFQVMTEPLDLWTAVTLASGQ
ncbi:hypothetical protein LLG96_17235 [bacterium]|nr:hypothetical protein [bacterium]